MLNLTLPETEPSLPLRWKAAAGLFLLAWFLTFSRDVLRVQFSPDDMMNIDNFYWTPGPWRLFYSQFLLWRGYYRPMGGLFYYPIYSLAGLNPAPYHVGLTLLALVNVYLIYRLALRLGSGSLAAGLAALVVCYHAGLANLYYNTAFVYDALCGLFFAASLVYYTGLRNRGEQLTGRRLVYFLSLLVCALNSKEMALTLPGVLIAYEWIYQSAGRRQWRPAIIAGVLTLANLYGKLFGVEALTGPGYSPVFSWQRVIDYQKTFLADAAFWNAGAAGVIGFWIVVTYLAWRVGASPVLRFAWALLLLTPVPIEFLPGKSQACLFIPMLGLALFVTPLFTGISQACAKLLAAEPIFRRLGPASLTGLLLTAGVFYWGRENLHRQRVFVKPVMEALGEQTAGVIAQFRAVHPQVRPGSHVVFLNDPFTAWDMQFIADLWFHDRSVIVHLQRLNPVPEGDVARAAAVFDYRDGKLVRVR